MAWFCASILARNSSSSFSFSSFEFFAFTDDTIININTSIPAPIAINSFFLPSKVLITSKQLLSQLGKYPYFFISTPVLNMVLVAM